jgi:ketosteroid isomerase-like protein
VADDKDHSRALIERWANAVHTADMDGVLADHSDDIVMFDVPPPTDESGASVAGAELGPDVAMRRDSKPVLGRVAVGGGDWQAP